MRIRIDADLRAIKGGFAADSPVLRLTGHGKTPAEAIDSLQHVLVAYWRGLQLAGKLPAEEFGISIEGHETDEVIAVEVVPNMKVRSL